MYSYEYAEELQPTLYMGCTLAPPGNYYWTVRPRRRCRLMSNYFDHLYILLKRCLQLHTVY